MEKNFTTGNILKGLITFSLPYLLSCFLQTFYGMADLYVVGQFNGADSISAVSIGSQVMHMLTVMIVGLAMGSTVQISQAVGKGDNEKIKKTIGNTIVIFGILSVILTVLLLFGTNLIISLLSTPPEAAAQTRIYLIVCFIGIPLIIAYNIISCIFRGIGDSRSPLYFIIIACIFNIVLDFILVGGFSLGAVGAALATVISQGISVFAALFVIHRKNLLHLSFHKEDFIPVKHIITSILSIGIPITCQDGFIQVSFLFITAIANSRGVIAAASVGIVEKIISFLFLVPSAMLSSISAIAAQNVGAGQPERARQTLRYGLTIAVSFGLFISVLFQFISPQVLGLFTKNTEVIETGSQYLRAYVLDCVTAAIHFCFSGFFCAYGKSFLSFIQNLISIILIRIPGAWLAAVFFPATLYPMGLAAPAGSLLSAVICIIIFFRIKWDT